MRFRSTLLPLVLLSMSACGRDAPVDREADRLMRDMSTLLEEAPRFSFAASEIRDVVDREGETSQLALAIDQFLLKLATKSPCTGALDRT